MQIQKYSVLAVSLIFVSGCTTAGEGRNTNNLGECVGGQIVTDYVYEHKPQPRIVRSDGVTGWGWGRTPSISNLSEPNYAEVHAERHRNYVINLDSEPEAGEWVSATEKTDFYRFSATLKIKGQIILDPEFETGGQNVRHGNDYCLDSNGNLYYRPSARER